jgi:DNA-binding NarL/FixJ family response regulator
MMLLIAEDNELMRQMLRSLVEDLPYEIVECGDGSAAIDLYEKHRPAWVLMDVSMRPVDGLSATREIIARDGSARIAIVTEHDDAETRRFALEAGAKAFFGKSHLLPLRSLLKDPNPSVVPVWELG